MDEYKHWQETEQSQEDKSTKWAEAKLDLDLTYLMTTPT